MLPIAIPPSPLHADRTIALTRVVLAAICLFAVYVDPGQPARSAALTYTLLAGYVVYAVLLAAAIWNRPNAMVGLATHALDVGAFSVLQSLTLGPSSPFFVYFVFSLFCGTMRWGWRGTMWTAAAVTACYVVMAISMHGGLGASPFELNRFIIRLAYLAMVSALLVYLSRHEAALRDLIGNLAHWPRLSGLSLDDAIGRVLERAAEIAGAGRVVAIWDGGEAWTFEARWERGCPARLERHAASPLAGLPPGLAEATFVAAGRSGVQTIQLATSDGVLREWMDGLPSSRLLEGMTAGGRGGVLSAPLLGNLAVGRVFFAELDRPPQEVLPLAEVVTRAMAVSLEQIHLSERQREVAVFQERISLARDLHDGVLQSLMGIRLELQAAAAELNGPDAGRTGRRLADIERALAFEQRELRLFIQDLRPSRTGGSGALPLARRLEAVRQRVALEWTAPVSLRVPDLSLRLSPPAERAVPLMVHEAIVNALKHGRASHVTVDVQADGDQLRIAVEDDGRGFPFMGRYDHSALAASGSGPASLRDRAAALGGSLSVESTAGGSRVMLVIPRAVTVECASA